jgi:hypothetical protein
LEHLIRESKLPPTAEGGVTTVLAAALHYEDAVERFNFAADFETMGGGPTDADAIFREKLGRAAHLLIEVVRLRPDPYLSSYENYLPTSWAGSPASRNSSDLAAS